jgi:O-antigen/teichoic acid export membrane protein
MTTHRQIAKNTVAIAISSVITLFLSIFFTAAFARYLGVETYGLFAFAASFVALFGLFFDLGLNALIVREVGRHKEKISFYFGNTFVIEIIVSSLLIILIYCFAYLLGYPGETLLIVLLSAIFLAFEMFVQLIFSTFNAYERREYEALINIVAKFIYVLFGFIGIYFQLPLFEIVILFIFSSGIKYIISYYTLVRNVYKPKIKVDINSWLPLIKLAFPFALGGFLGIVYFNVDMTLLSLLQGNEAVAYYSVAYSFISMVMIIPSSLVLTIWPLLSRLFIQSKDSLIKAYSKMTQYLLMLAVPISIGMFFISDILIMTIFGDKYANSIIPLKILVWVIIFHFITYNCGTTLNAVDKQILSSIGLMSSLFINILLNLILIPQYGYIGASIVTIVTEIVLLIQYNYFLSKNGIPSHFLRFTYKPLIGGIVMGIFIYFIKIVLDAFPGIIQLLIIIPTAAVVYFLVLLTIKAFNDEDKDIFIKIIDQKILN